MQKRRRGGLVWKVLLVLAASLGLAVAMLNWLPWEEFLEDAPLSKVMQERASKSRAPARPVPPDKPAAREEAVPAPRPTAEPVAQEPPAKDAQPQAAASPAQAVAAKPEPEPSPAPPIPLSVEAQIYPTADAARQQAPVAAEPKAAPTPAPPAPAPPRAAVAIQPAPSPAPPRAASPARPAPSSLPEDAGPQVLGHVLQAGLFVGPVQSGRLAKSLEQAGFPAYVLRREQPGKVRYVVLVGPFAVKDKALEAIPQIERKLRLKTYLTDPADPGRQLR